MNRSFVGLIFSLLLVLPTQAQEPSAIDALQSNGRVESIRSLQQFMFDIAFLDLEIQERLIKARLTNGQIFFNNVIVLKSADDYVTTNALSIKKDLWTTSSTVYLSYKNAYYNDDILHLRLEIELEPNAVLNEWMKARDEYTSYSKEALSDERAKLNGKGTISKFTWTKEATSEVDNELIYDPLTYVLTLKLSSYSTSLLRFEGSDTCILVESQGHKKQECSYNYLSGTVPKLTQYLRDKTSQWVKFYMGKGKKPALILE